MMAHMASPEKLVEQALLMESYGAQCVYVTDSAGAMVTDSYAERIKAVREALKPETEVGVHAHENLSVSVANSVAAVKKRLPGRRQPRRPRRCRGQHAARGLRRRL